MKTLLTKVMIAATLLISVNAVAENENKCPKTPSIVACGDTSVLDVGCDIKCKKNSGSEPICQAASCGPANNEYKLCDLPFSTCVVSIDKDGNSKKFLYHRSSCFCD